MQRKNVYPFLLRINADRKDFFASDIDICGVIGYNKDGGKLFCLSYESFAAFVKSRRTLPLSGSFKIQSCVSAQLFFYKLSLSEVRKKLFSASGIDLCGVI